MARMRLSRSGRPDHQGRYGAPRGTGRALSLQLLPRLRPLPDRQGTEVFAFENRQAWLHAPVPGGNHAGAAYQMSASSPRGLLKRLFTRILLRGRGPPTPQIRSSALVPANRRDTLLAKPDAAKPGLFRFDYPPPGLQRDGVFSTLD